MKSMINYIKIICPNNLKKFLRKIKPKKIDPMHAKDLFLKKSVLLNNINEIETLVLGSSHGDYGFNPLYSDKVSYNLCYTSQDLYYSYKLYEKLYNKTPKMKNIIVFYSVFSSGLELEKTSEYPICSCYKLLFDIPYKTNKSYKKIEKQFSKELLEPLTIPDYYLGYNNPQIFFSENFGVKNRVKTHLRENLRSNKQNDYINKIFELSKQANHNLTIIIPPARSDYKSNLPDSADLFKKLYIISNNRFNILNFYDNNDFLFEDFGDFDHLNCDGAEKLTKKINEYL